MDLFKKRKASDIGALIPKAVRWALDLSLPAMREPAGFKYLRFKLCDWRSRRSATAAIACQLVQQGLGELSRHVGLVSLPHPLFDLDAYDTSMADRAEAAQGYGRLKLGAASVGFWPPGAVSTTPTTAWTMLQKSPANRMRPIGGCAPARQCLARWPCRSKLKV